VPSFLKKIFSNPSSGRFLVLISLYFYFALRSLAYPGVHFDEWYYVNPSMGDLDGTLVTDSVFGIPAFHIFYLGFWKAWVMKPVFWFFEPSVWSTRLPNLFFTTGFLFLYFHLLRKQLGLIVASWATVILVVHPDFVFFTRLDFGPVVWEMIFQWLCLTLFFQSSGWLSFFLTLALFNKLTFLWWSVASFLSGFSLFPEKRKSLAIAISLPLLFLLYRFVNLSNSQEFLFGSEWWAQGRILWDEFLKLLSGTSFQTFLREKLNSPWLLGAWLMALIFFLYAFLSKSRGAERRFLLLCSLILALQLPFFFLIPEARKAWHLLPLLPFLTLLAGYAMAHTSKLGKCLGVLILALLLSEHYFILRFRELPKDPRWSPAIFELADYCRKGSQFCISVDWGIHNQLLALIRDEKKAQPFQEKIHKDAVYILFRPEIIRTSTRKEFFEKLEERKIRSNHLGGDSFSPLFRDTYRLYKLE